MSIHFIGQKRFGDCSNVRETGYSYNKGRVVTYIISQFLSHVM